jgi:hypothetical protein
VSTTDVSGGGGTADMKRAVDNDGAAEIVDATYLVRAMAAGPTIALVLLCAVNDRARELSSIRVARRSRDFMLLIIVDWRSDVEVRRSELQNSCTNSFVELRVEIGRGCRLQSFAREQTT